MLDFVIAHRFTIGKLIVLLEITGLDLFTLDPFLAFAFIIAAFIFIEFTPLYIAFDLDPFLPFDLAFPTSAFNLDPFPTFTIRHITVDLDHHLVFGLVIAVVQLHRYFEQVVALLTHLPFLKI